VTPRRDCDVNTGRKGCKVLVTDDEGRIFSSSTIRRALRRADQRQA
jgi:hypothetical protein